MTVNKYEVEYGSLFTCRRIIWAESEHAVLIHCQEKFPNIFPLKGINLLEEDVDINTRGAAL